MDSKKKQRLLFFILAGIAVFFVVALIYTNYLGDDKVEKKERKESFEPQFQKEGRLWFLSGDGSDTLSTIAIEFAEDSYEIPMGLMHRTKMEEKQGMLFIFPDMRQRSFWMKNTHIPLDIVYVNDRKQIVSIASYTKPFSEQSIPSKKPAQFVVEVNAGFCERHGIKKGDFIKFKRL